jgi:uncharacterized coiled-coil protein SlyX
MKTISVEISSGDNQLVSQAIRILTKVVDAGFKKKKGKGATGKNTVQKAIEKFVRSLPEKDLQELIESKYENTETSEDRLLALAYNMKQQSTRMPKEKIAERSERHKAMITKRKNRIKELEMKKKNSTNPDTVKRISQIVTKHKDRIDRHNEALKYYKMLGSLKPKTHKDIVKKKTNPMGQSTK